MSKGGRSGALDPCGAPAPQRQSARPAWRGGRRRVRAGQLQARAPKPASRRLPRPRARATRAAAPAPAAGKVWPARARACCPRSTRTGRGRAVRVGRGSRERCRRQERRPQRPRGGVARSHLAPPAALTPVALTQGWWRRRRPRQTQLRRAARPAAFPPRQRGECNPQGRVCSWLGLCGRWGRVRGREARRRMPQRQRRSSPPSAPDRAGRGASAAHRSPQQPRGCRRGHGSALGRNGVGG